MGEIKSAFEKAMEKVERLEPPTKEKRLEWSGVPKGQALAAKLLKGGATSADLSSYGQEERPHVLRGALQVLVANIQLPQSAASEQAAKQAMDAIRMLMGSSPQANEILGRVAYVSEQYKTHGEQQRQQAFLQLKQQFQAHVQQQLQQQGAAPAQPVNVEVLPEFQQEALRLKVRLDQQYEQHLEGYRQELLALA
ncbi:MAG: hypothetical protein V3V35_01990 [Dehalococcoidia bacterium]